MQDKLKKLIGDNINFVFVGEAGSGKARFPLISQNGWCSFRTSRYISLTWI